MPKRRFFVGCALCALGGLIATSVAAQSTAPATATGVRRKVLQQTDGPTPGYVTVVVEIEVDADATVARHTHPGIESTYLIEGDGELLVDGQPSRRLKPGDAFQILVATPHSYKNGGKPAKFVGTFVVEKGQPLASPA
jgi:quercetin dioxygenase-like cupin family protein